MLDFASVDSGMPVRSIISFSPGCAGAIRGSGCHASVVGFRGSHGCDLRGGAFDVFPIAYHDSWINTQGGMHSLHFPVRGTDHAAPCRNDSRRSAGGTVNSGAAGRRSSSPTSSPARRFMPSVARGELPLRSWWSSRRQILLEESYGYADVRNDRSIRKTRYSARFGIESLPCRVMQQFERGKPISTRTSPLHRLQDSAGSRASRSAVAPHAHTADSSNGQGTDHDRIARCRSSATS